MRTVIWVAMAAVLAMAGCDKPKPKQASLAGAPTAVAAPGADMPVVASGSTTSLTPASAFRLAFDGKSRIEVKRRGYQVFRFAPAALIPVNDDLVALVSTGVGEKTCTGCKGLLAVHYFRRQGASWALAGAWEALVAGNAGGRPPAWRPRPDLGPGVWLEATIQAGNSVGNCTYADLVELTPWEPVVRGDDIPLDFDNGAIGVKGQVSRNPDGGVRVTYSGSMGGVTDYALAGDYLQALPGDPVVSC